MAYHTIVISKQVLKLTMQTETLNKQEITQILYKKNKQTKQNVDKQTVNMNKTNM